MKKRIAMILPLLAVFMLLTSLRAPDVSTDTDPVSVKWMTFEEAVEKMKKEKRKIFIDVYTDWCGYCKVMDKNTFTDEKVAGLLNQHFYPVKLNAEQKADIVFNGNTYKYIASGRGGYHELAAALLNNQLSYPNFVFLNDDYAIIPVIPGQGSVPGYRKPEEFHLFLSFISGDHWKHMQITDFQQVYKSPYSTPK